ncbi:MULTISPECIES: adenylate/guanylate cyclase domain-containing protein [unclassified Mycobacterium]|uniref:adenylate/guanylate cyclase domain-containing protein n=1 Tax=unclassified Mycobacterium TaxID=2642494 RepID=UPI0029C6C3A0|nr:MULTISPECIES: adenylate/guanylate cyclase domain-containing protein [unclassified Mycobacterium]
MTDSPTDAEGVLSHAGDVGEIRQLTLFFADLVDSTALSTRVEPETYRLVVGRYREQVVRIVGSFDGHIGSTKGDGLLAVFGHPIAREDDARRAVRAGLEITREVLRLSDQSRRQFGFGVNVRVGVHQGLVYLDAARGDLSGLAANVATGISGCAPPGAVVVSDAIETLIQNDFELAARAPVAVNGVREPVINYLVASEHAPTV